jgi:hypothetical protein
MILIKAMLALALAKSVNYDCNVGGTLKLTFTIVNYDCKKFIVNYDCKKFIVNYGCKKFIVDYDCKKFIVQVTMLNVK